MGVYVDPLFTMEGRNAQACRAGEKHGHQWSHLFADYADTEKLHAIAQQIGLRRDWFQPDRSGGHYDVVPTMRRKALAYGVQELEREAAVGVWENNRAALAVGTQLLLMGPGLAAQTRLATLAALLRNQPDGTPGLYLMERQNTPRLRGLWACPGGWIEPNEEPIDGIRREVKEETGLDLPRYRFSFFGTRVGQTEQGDHFLGLQFICPLAPGEEPKQTEPHKLGPWQLFDYDSALRLPLIDGGQMIRQLMERKKRA